MKKYVLFIGILSLFSVYTFSQNANINYEVRVTGAGVYTSEGFSWDGASCWESGNEEYTASLRIDGPNVGSTVCLTCDNNSGSCNYGGGTVLRSSANVPVYNFTVVYDMFEDDVSPRCSFGSDWTGASDDCRGVGSYNIPMIENVYPSATNAYNGYQDNLVYNSGGSQHRVRLDYSWRYSGSTNAIAPSCAAASIGYNGGAIRSWSVYMNAGQTFNFNNCSSTNNDTYMRLYSPDGYTIVATADDNCGALSSLTYTAVSTGWHYLELSQYVRGPLSLGGTLTYQNVTPIPGNPAVFGNNQWLVYAYNGGNINLTGTYFGYYTETNLSYSTESRWCSNCSPSDASGYQGCLVPVDNHVVVYKRQGFPCGVYQLDMPTHDDDARVYVNGNLVWSHEPGCCDAHPNIWTGYLGATSTIEVRHLEGGGGSVQALTLNNITTTVNGGSIGGIANGITICSGGDPGAFTNVTSPSGGTMSTANGNPPATTYQWQASTSGPASGYSDIIGQNGLTYDPTSVNVTTWYRRATIDACGTVGYSNVIQVVVVPDPAAPTATKSPNTLTICLGGTFTITSPQLGIGGTGSCIIEYALSTDGGLTYSSWSTTIPSGIATGTDNRIKMRTNCNGTGCDISPETVYIWQVVPDPSAPTASKLPNSTTVCLGANLSLINPVATGGGSGVCNFEYAFSTNGGISYSSWSTVVPNFAATGTDNRIKIRTNCNGTGCDISPETVYTWTVVQDPQAPTATKSPNVNTVCVGASLSLTTIVPGLGGTGNCVTEYATSSNGGLSYTAWTSTPPTITATGTDNRIKIRTNCDGSGCDISPETIYTWTVVQDPSAPSAVKSPNVPTVCEGSALSLAGVTAGFGGTGNCIFEYSTSIDGGVTYTPWSNVSPVINATGTNNRIRVRTVCDGVACDISPFAEYSWNVVLDPQAPTATKSPNVADVCEGDTLTLINVIDNGGGVGNCVFEYCYSTDNGVTFTSWSTTIPSFLSVAGGNNIIKVRKNCDGNGCNLSPETSYSWFVYSILPPTITITASDVSICDGDPVTFTANTFYPGPSPQYAWFINGVNLNTNSSSITIDTLDNLDVINATLVSNFGCSFTPYATSNYLIVNVGDIPVSPSVSITASDINICAGELVVFTASAVSPGTNPVYQWFINGNPVGSNSNVFTSTTLNNGDQVTVTLTSSEPCVTNQSATSNVISMTVNSTAGAGLIIIPSETSICIGDVVTFSSTPTNPGPSPAYEWFINGVPQTNNSTTFTYNSFNNGDVVTATLVSSNGCANPQIATSNAVVMNVGTNPLTPTVSVSASATNICSGTNVIFFASSTYGGNNPAYQWFLNGNPVGTNAVIYSNSSLNNNDIITLSMTSSEGCVSSATVVSNAITMTVNQSLNPSINITSTALPVCSGTNISFNSNITGAGANPTYEWFVNGIAQNNNATTFSSSNLNNGDVVTAIVTPSQACATPASAVSNNIFMNIISTPAAPVVSINASQTTICSGTNVVFNAIAQNTGNNPTYQWFINGNPVGSNSSLFSSAALANGDIITVQLNSTQPCQNINTVVSSPVLMTVNPVSAPTAAIFTSNTSICSGNSVTFNATVTNQGLSPVYEWYVNGVAQNNNSTTFITTSLNNNDVVNMMVTSSQVCATPVSVLSNNLVMSVGQTVTPAVTINVNDSTICDGAFVVFNALATNGGNNPSFQWYVNGVPSGFGGSVFSSSDFNDQDAIYVEFTSSNGCAVPAMATSQTVTIDVTQVITPSVYITTTQTSLCLGDQVDVTSSVNNAGSNVTYEWFINGVSTSSSDTAYTYTATNNGDILSLTITALDACVSPSQLESNDIVFNVNPTPTATLSIASTNGLLCEGTDITFTSVATNAGMNPQYIWTVNNTSAGVNSDVFVSSPLTAGDVVSAYLISDNPCSINDTAFANQLIILQSPEVNAGVDVSILEGDSIQLSAIGSIPGIYTWSPSGTLNSAFVSAPWASPTTTTEYTVVLTTTDGCSAQDGVVITVKEDLVIYTSFTPNGDGVNDTWIIDNIEEYEACTVEIFNRWGNKVYSSVGYSAPWDGKHEGEMQPFGVYQYIIHLYDGAKPLEGTVTILK